MANERARDLRKRRTTPERRLWLRLLQDRGFKFRQQAPIDSYIVDFVCFSERLTIEIDGWTHGTAEEKKRDARRDAYLRRQGVRIVRVSNTDVMKNMDGVMLAILAELGATPTPGPSPQGGGEEFAGAPSDAAGRPNVRRGVRS